MAASSKPAMTVAEIAEELGISPTRVSKLLSTALRKLHDSGRLFTARQLSEHLDHHRATEHTVYRRNGRKGGAE